VIVPVNTFIATAESAVLCGATPVFVDHDRYFNLDASKIEQAITPRTKAIIAVHLYGQPANMTAIKAIADKHHIALIEDAAQAHFAVIDGKPIGSWGVATCFSFYPGKNLGAYGEGGAVITNNSELVETMRVLRDHGSVMKYQHQVSGHNYRMEALQGAILNVKMRYIDGWNAKRTDHASTYRTLLDGCDGVVLPEVQPTAKPVWHLYIVRVKEREALQQFLQSRNISTGLHYPIPLHKQQAFAHLGYTTGAFPAAEASASEILSLPMYPELTPEQIRWVCDSIKAFYSKD
jgi:dTDP-4-amino-4,6-dideoxygalactose transaminase